MLDITTETFRLSPLQRHLCALQGSTTSLSYSTYCAMRIEGLLDSGRLQAALGKVLKRHEILRTTFPLMPGLSLPVQVISEDCSFPFSVYDLCSLSSAEQEKIFSQLSGSLRSLRLDLSNGPLFHAFLISRSKEAHVLYFVTSALTMDTYSCNIVLDEICHYYAVNTVDEREQDEPVQYADAAEWQYEVLEAEESVPGKKYWRSLASSDLMGVPLPYERAREISSLFTLDAVSQHFAEALMAEVQTLAQHLTVSPAAVFLSCWLLVLRRMTSTKDLLIGTGYDGRKYEELLRAVGVFAKYVPLQFHLLDECRFSDLVVQVEEKLQDASLWQEYFDWEQVEASDEKGLEPFCAFGFDCETLPFPLYKDNLLFSIEEKRACLDRCNVRLSCACNPQGLVATLFYDQQVVCKGDMERLLAQWHTVLVQALEGPHSALSHVQMLTNGERQLLLHEWNATQTSYPRDTCAHVLVERQVWRTPDCIAVACGDDQVTYQRLAVQANRLAHYLQQQGVGPEVCVGLFLERSIEMIVGLLGILKAGGAYVPLDVTYPQERLAFIVSDARVPVILTREPLLTKVPASAAQVICLDERWKAIEQENSDVLNSSVGTTNLAYLIYTSGSTGRPKGVMVSHRELVNYLCWSTQTYDVAHGSGTLVHSSLSFDLTITGLFPPLLVGSSIFLLPEGQGIEELSNVFQAHNDLSLVKLTPAHLDLLNKLVAPEMANERTNAFIIGGEALYSSSLSFWRRYASHTRLINEYGPTETVVGCCVYEASAETPESGPLPIGRPIANTCLYVLDEYYYPAAIGVPGELYIGGDGVTRGYLNRPDVTAERFMPDPFSSSPGQRLYKTGDLVRYGDDGNLIFLGRLDSQVKVRGFRIELGEIEAHLVEHPAIHEAVVLARDDMPGGRHLVAYIVGKQSDVALSIDELRTYLQGRLPEYMLPSFFMLLKKLPLTAHAKIDRGALPVPDTNPYTMNASFVLPQTETEAILAAIWSEVLHMTQVGIHDNFFAIGGDSILSIQVVTLAKQAGIHLTPRQLFQYQTIAQLASVVVQRSGSSPAESLPVSGPVVLTPIQQWFFALAMPERQHYNFSALFEIHMQLHPTQLQRMLQLLLLQHAALRLRFVHDDAGWHQYQCDYSPDVPFLCIDLSNLDRKLQVHQMESLAAVAQKSLDLATPPLLRCLFFKDSNLDSAYLLLIMHHLVVDGVSWRILFADLETALSQLATHQDLHLPNKTSSFQQWSQALYEYAQSERVLQELPYWLATKKANRKPLPVDALAGSDTALYSETCHVHLDVQQTQALLKDVPSVYHTQINDILLTALVRAFASWTGQRVLLVDLESHGREEALGEGDLDLSRSVGWFTALFPVLLDIEHATTIAEEIKMVKEQLWQIPQHGIGYGLLRYLHSDASVRTQLVDLPVAQVSFNYLGQFGSSSQGKAHLQQVPFNIGLAHSDTRQMSHLLTINGSVTDGELRFAWQYSRQTYQPETMQRLAQRFVDALRDIIAHCQSPEAGGYTPSDFPLVALDQVSLDQLAQRVQQPGPGGQSQHIEDIYPLSPMQEGMLFHSLYNPTEGLYHGLFGWIIQEETFNITAWQWAWQQVVKRHSVLRTLFLWQGVKEPVQVVMRHVQLPWNYYDWRGMSVQKQRELLDTIYRESKQQDFDLETAPLLRLTLIYLGEHTYYFLLNQHHLLWDGWSHPLLVAELQRCYQVYGSGSDPKLLPARPYRDYIAWLRQQDTERAERFWRGHLQGFTAPTILDIDLDPSMRRVQTDTAIDAQHLQLSKEESRSLQELARQHGLTMNTIVQGAWGWLLALYSAKNDVVFGATVAGRSAEIPGVESMIGLFINTLPVRIQIKADMPLISWLSQLQKQQAEMRQYEYTPLTDIKRWSEVPADQPLFESLLLFQNYPSPHRHESGLTDEKAPSGSAPTNALTMRPDRGIELTNYPLDLAAMVDQDILVLSLSYQKVRFDTAAIRRLLEHLRLVLMAMGTRWEQPLRDLPRLTKTDHALVLSTWNATERALPQDQRVHQLIEEQVARTPDALAVQHEEASLSYAVLNQLANQLAHRLIGLGVGSERLVGICLPRSLDMVIALLAIFKAGGAYVPLDPTYPKDRLAFLVQDAQPVVIVTQEHLLAGLPEQSRQIICLDAQKMIPTDEDTVPIDSRVDPDNLAYVIYTSGSTGKPKGILTRHRSLVNYIEYARNAYGIRAGERVLQFASINFDASAEEIYPCLMSGATLVLRTDEQLSSMATFLHACDTWGITILSVPTAYWHEITLRVTEDGLLVPPSLRSVLIGTERALPERLSAWQQLVGCNVRLFNTYGPTETTVVVTVSELTQAELQPAWEVSIGRPIANTQIYILDAQGSPVPIGAKGELYIGGIGVARGYHGRPDLTAQLFVPHPFSQEAGARLYRSGDLARYREDGMIEFLGRIDRQIKLYGVRIEPGEIEWVLLQYPEVEACVVILQTDAMGNPRLVAYVAGIPEERVGRAKDALRKHATGLLPRTMVPSHFIFIEQMPLTNQGSKVDLHRLPRPEESGGEVEENDKEWSLIEELLGQIWSEVLGVSVRERGQSFFELGGHSLLATRVIAQMRDVLRVELSVRTLFEAATITELAHVVEQELRGGQVWQAPFLVQVERREQVLPLSFAQQRLWFLDQLEPESTAYLIQSVHRLEGSLDFAVFQRSLQEMVQRHESLRTTFEEEAGQPFQLIHPASVLPFPLVDLQAIPDEERGRQVARLIVQEKQQPCDLRRGPLLRIWVLRLKTEEYVLLDTIHHSISDAWSSDIFYRELTTLYEAFAAGEPSPLLPLPIQYVDFAIWQRQWLQGAVLEQQVAYWREQLAGVQPLALPIDHPRPPLKTYHGAQQTLHLPVSLQKELRALSQQEQVTLFMLLLAAFQVLLARYSGQEDIAVGTPIANRTHKEVEGLIGFFVNTLVLRSDLSGNPLFVELLGQVRERALGAYAHQDVPFEHLVEVLQPERDLSRSTLFQVMFTMQQSSLAHQDVQPQAPHSVQATQTMAKFDLTMHIMSDPAGLTCGIEYNTDLFDGATIQRLLRYWHCLLEGIVSAPRTAVFDLPLLPDEEVQLLRSEWNAPGSSYQQVGCLHERFEEQVLRSPDAVVLVFRDEQISYGHLNRRANQVAHQLQEWGSGAESRVGICLPRSPLQIIAVLATLKVGGVYLPLDPLFPPDRLSWMLEDAGAELVLTLRDQGRQLSGERVRCLCLDEEEQGVWEQEEKNLLQPVHPAQAAYVLYTSGSTGQPKGVVVEHRQVANYSAAMQEQAGLTAPAAYAMLQPLTVDSCVTMLFPPLLMGGVLHVITYELSLDADALARYFAQWALDYLKIAPSHLFALLASRPQLLPRRKLIVGGEASQWSWLQHLQARWPEGEVYNHYGPTETTVGSLLYRVSGVQEEEQAAFTPLGRALGNTQIYIVDSRGHLQPRGAVGELYIGGAGLARGYVGRPDVTAERFVPHPWSAGEGERLYKTGDLVRYRGDGMIEFIGRSDEQVKVRGYRIEPGEIERVLEAHPAIQEARVIALEGEGGQKQLVGYVVREDGARHSTQDVREYVRIYLPDYMVPARLHWLEELPRTPHGKVDRKMLVALAQQHGFEEEEEEKIKSQGSEVEELVASVWGRVLGVKQVDRQDQFFAAGGHSLLAMQLIARLRAILRVEIPLRWLFEAPKLLDLAQRIEEAMRKNQWGEELPLVPVSRLQALPLSFAQQRLWFLDQLEPASPLYTIPGVQLLHGSLDRRVLERSLEELIQRHESLRTTFHECRQANALVQIGQPIQYIHPVQSFHLPVIDLSSLTAMVRKEQEQRLIQQVVQTPFDLAQGPLLRVWIVQLATDEHLSLAAMHHIITDGWSMNLFYHELKQLYQAFSSGKPSPLTPLPIQYADFAVWQRQRLQGEMLEQQMNYWRHQLSGVSPLILPADYPRPVVPSHRGASHRFSLSSQLSQALILLSRQEDITQFMLLLAAFQVLLYRYSGQTDSVIGTDSANRSHVETENLIGFFINLLALRTRLHGTWPFKQLLRQVRATVLDAYMYQETPFDLLVEKIIPDRSLDQMPLVQALFVMQNFPDLAEKMDEQHVQMNADTQEADGSLQHLEKRETVIKFDLVLFMWEEAGQFHGSLDYSLDLFAAQTITTLIERFVALLQSIVQQPETPIDQLNFFTASERVQETLKEQTFHRKLRKHRGERFELPGNDFAG